MPSPHSDSELDDAVHAKLLTGALKHVARSSDPLLRDLAREVLGGRTAITDIADDPAVADRLLDATRRAKQWRETLTDAELAGHVSQTQQRLDDIRSRLTGDEGRQ